MITLPTCHHRGPELPDQPARYPCACPKLATRGSVSAEYCRDKCRFVDSPATAKPKPDPTRRVVILPAKSKGGPGTELKKLLAELGLTASDCACNKRARLMDYWGPNGCRERRAEIVAWLKAQQEKRGWLTTIAAAGRALATGLAFWLDPLDPLGSLVDEAIRRASPP